MDKIIEELIHDKNLDNYLDEIIMEMDQKSKEVIIPVTDFPNYYITSFGNVISRKKQVMKYLRPGADKKGFLHVNLCKNNERVSVKVHRLVASHFLKNDHNKRVVLHKYGNKRNNNVSNLYWTDLSRVPKPKYKNNKSGFAGVIFYRNKWKAFINIHGKQYTIGNFLNKEDAINARKNAKINISNYK